MSFFYSIFYNKIYITRYILLIFISCDNNNLQNFEFELRQEVLVENAVFRISYNEKREQPNWIEYTVRDFIKVADHINEDSDLSTATPMLKHGFENRFKKDSES